MPLPQRVKIQAGVFRKPISIVNRVTIPTSAGGVTSTWPAVFVNVFAADMHKPATLVTEGGQLVSAVRHIYTIRYRPGVTKGMFVQDPHFPDRMYIESVTDPDGERHILELLCTDVET